jgi:peptidylprolyl isomerase
MTSTRVRIATISATAALALTLGACSSTSGTSNGSSTESAPASASASAEPSAPTGELKTTDLKAIDVTVKNVGKDMTVTFPFPAQASKLSKEDTKTGNGKAVVGTDSVTVNYYLASALTGEKKQSSFDTKPFTSSLSQLIPAWQEGIPGMKAGGERILVVPEALGYPGDGTLVFVVQLISIDS